MTTCLAGLQYLPPVEYFVHWLHHPHFVIEANEHYQKKTWRNKTAILSGQGPLTLSVPLTKGKHQEKPIHEVTISYDEPWHKNHFYSLQTAYGKTAFFDEIEAELSGIYFNQPSHLWELNMQILKAITDMTGWDHTFQITEQFESNPPSETIDLRKGVPGGETILAAELIPTYQQVHRFGKPFLPNLSILDVLCHLGPATCEYLRQYEHKLYPSAK